MPTTGKTVRVRGGEWTLQRLSGNLPWQVTHLPTQITFRETSQREARNRITSGWYAQQITDRMRPQPPSRRDWWQDPISGVWHLWTGGLFDWTCWVHQRVCSPTAPVAGDDILRMAARDEQVTDDVFVMLRQATENRPIDLGKER
ncbi:hypothetical protein [Micromonospora sediminicola]|uniref:hypothetical protein n=1 Tax=Micromonospora sediminicola TaxID=946078 RepID=UPI00379A2309